MQPDPKKETVTKLETKTASAKRRDLTGIITLFTLIVTLIVGVLTYLQTRSDSNEKIAEDRKNREAAYEDNVAEAETKSDQIAYDRKLSIQQINVVNRTTNRQQFAVSYQLLNHHWLSVGYYSVLPNNSLLLGITGNEDIYMSFKDTSTAPVYINAAKLKMGEKKVALIRKNERFELLIDRIAPFEDIDTVVFFKCQLLQAKSIVFSDK